MLRPAQHTVFRFKVRAMLIVMLAVAVLLAAAMPWVRTLDVYQEWHVAAVAVAFSIGMFCSFFFLVLRRRRVGLQCGKLLLEIRRRASGLEVGVEAGSLLFGFVYTIVYLFFVGDPTNRDDFGIVFVPLVTFPFLCWCGAIVAKEGLVYLAEGFGRSTEFCENGLVIGNRFHTWDAASLSDISWTKPGDELVIIINEQIQSVVAVPSHQRESVRKILDQCYTPRTPVAA